MRPACRAGRCRFESYHSDSWRHRVVVSRDLDMVKTQIRLLLSPLADTWSSLAYDARLTCERPKVRILPCPLRCVVESGHYPSTVLRRRSYPLTRVKALWLKNRLGRRRPVHIREVAGSNPAASTLLTEDKRNLRITLFTADVQSRRFRRVSRFLCPRVPIIS